MTGLKLYGTPSGSRDGTNSPWASKASPPARSGRPHFVTTLNAELILLARRSPDFETVHVFARRGAVDWRRRRTGG